MVYAVIESDEGGRLLDEFEESSRAGGVFRSDDASLRTGPRISAFAPRAFYFSQIRVQPDSTRVYLLGFSISMFRTTAA